jgi:phospholipid transport system transporter-binding protein
VILREGDRMMVSGPLTLSQVAQALPQGNGAIGEGARTVDLGGVTELDSSALALLLAWLREAKRRNAELAFSNLPQGLTTIARLYGVAELLPATAASTHH